MLTEQEFETFKAQFCDGKSWTATFLEPGGLTRWKCNACGKEIQNNLTISASMIFGPHRKPGVSISVDLALPEDTIKIGDITVHNIAKDKP